MSRTTRFLAGCLLGLVTLVVATAQSASAHMMPYSVVALEVGDTSITAHLQIPVTDLAISSGVDLTGEDAQDVLEAKQQDLQDYLVDHVRPFTEDGQAWSVSVGTVTMSEAEQTDSGLYREVSADAVLTPPTGADLLRFDFKLDPVIHQVATHTVMVTAAESGSETSYDVGTVAIDTKTMSVPDLDVDLSNLDATPAWSGFGGMFSLGMHHIMEGTDHLLFLLTLLLPAPVLAAAGRWTGTVGPRTALIRIARITLAFTIGHSVTLAISALTRLEVPTRPIEALIAVSILIGAVNAARPLFPGREALVAAGFGLIHGMAFAFTLTELNLNTGQLVLSLLGFNLGIEVMQLLVVVLVLPSLLVLARGSWYRPVQFTGAVVAAIAATGWLVDRLGVANPVASTADLLGSRGWWFVAGLAVLAVLSLVWPPARGRAVEAGPDRQIVLPEDGSDHRPESDRKPEGERDLKGDRTIGSEDERRPVGDHA